MISNFTDRIKNKLIMYLYLLNVGDLQLLMPSPSKPASHLHSEVKAPVAKQVAFSAHFTPIQAAASVVILFY